MSEYFEVDENILDYLFVSYPCFNSSCLGKIVISLGNLYSDTRIRCPVCRREDSYHLTDKRYIEAVQRNFGYLYKQLHGLELSPVVFSPSTSSKTASLDSKPLGDTFQPPI
jgi:hypothetical protein